MAKGILRGKSSNLTKAMRKIHAATLACLIALAACAPLPPQPTEAPVVTPAQCSVTAPVCAPCPTCPPAAPLVAPPFTRNLQATTWADLPGWQEDDLSAAWPAFLQSCRGMASKPQGAAWKKICDEARADRGPLAANPRPFFEKNLRPYAVSNGDNKVEGMITGYYEPLLRGNRAPGPRFPHALRAVPDDLLTIDLGTVFPELKDKRVRGRLVGNKVVPYFSRAEIGSRGDNAPGRPIAYVDDAVELFFLQVQGSGRIQLPNGDLLRVNYADQNGHPYQSIGRVLVDRGELKLEEASMQGIQAWARANPKRLDDLLNSNPSYVFFREMPNSNGGPQGALGVPLTDERSLAIDPRSVPLGAPVFLATTRPNSNQPLNRLMLAQDTGGAIKGAVRADFFWGFGREAGEQAGRMKQSGRLWILWPVDAALK